MQNNVLKEHIAIKIEHCYRCPYKKVTIGEPDICTKVKRNSIEEIYRIPTIGRPKWCPLKME